MLVTPSLDELLEFVREELVEDSRQKVTLTFNVDYHNNLKISDTAFRAGDVWFQPQVGGGIEVYFSGPAWAAHHMILCLKKEKLRAELLEWDRQNRIASGSMTAAPEPTVYNNFICCGDVGKPPTFWDRLKDKVMLR